MELAKNWQGTGVDLAESLNGIRIRSFVANISGCSDWIHAPSSLFDSPGLGLHERKEISSIGLLDAKIFAIKDWVQFFETCESSSQVLYYVTEISVIKFAQIMRRPSLS